MLGKSGRPLGPRGSAVRAGRRLSHVQMNTREGVVVRSMLVLESKGIFVELHYIEIRLVPSPGSRAQ
jgi:hypothetical protein